MCVSELILALKVHFSKTRKRFISFKHRLSLGVKSYFIFYIVFCNFWVVGDKYVIHFCGSWKEALQKHTSLFVEPSFLKATVHLASMSLCWSSVHLDVDRISLHSSTAHNLISDTTKYSINFVRRNGNLSSLPLPQGNRFFSRQVACGSCLVSNWTLILSSPGNILNEQKRRKDSNLKSSVVFAANWALGWEDSGLEHFQTIPLKPSVCYEVLPFQASYWWWELIQDPGGVGNFLPQYWFLAVPPALTYAGSLPWV